MPFPPSLHLVGEPSRTRARLARACALATSVLLAWAIAFGANPPAAHASADIPVGTVVPWGGTAVPGGWLRADGSAVSRTTYAELFAVVGTTYGAGDGSTTFNLPDMRQRFALGQSTAGTGATLGSFGGTIDHTHALSSHLHSIVTNGAHFHDFNAHSHSTPGHRHTGISGVTMTAGGSHDHTLDGGRNFVVANGSGSLYNLASGSVPIDQRAVTTTAGNHNHAWSGNLGATGTGNNGNGALTSTTDQPPTSGTATGAHAHGGATGSASTTTGAANPPFLAVDYLVKVSSSAGAPCGAIWGTARASASPGSLLAQGGAVSRAGEANLFGCLSTTFGSGDGSTTFNLPNLRGRFPLGRATSGTGSVLGGAGGSLDHAHSQNHAHSITSDGSHTTTMPTHGHDARAHYHTASMSTSSDGAHDHGTGIGGAFIGEQTGGNYRGTTGTRDYDTPTSTNVAGGHNHDVSGNVGNTSGPLGDSQYAMGGSGAITSGAAGTHAHGGATSSTSAATGASNPAFRAINWELASGATYAPSTGTITPYAGTGAPPAGWMVADGSAISRTQYAALFTAIGTTYGAGDGSTTFNLPDLGGRFALGTAAAGTGSMLGGAGGSLDHGHTTSHAHGVSVEANHIHSGLTHTHSVPGHYHDFTKTFNSDGAHQHGFPGGGNFWGTLAAGGSSPVLNVSQGGSRNIGHPNTSGNAWGSHRHTSVTGTIGQATDPSGNAALTSGATDPGSTAGGSHDHATGADAPGITASNSPYLTLRYIIRVAGPSIVDNQLGDDTWRNANTGVYDVDFADPTGLARFETSVWSGTGMSGTQRQAWTQVAAIGGTSYTTNWALLASTWSAMAEGINYVSVRMFTTGDAQSALAPDTFYVRKDTVAPGNVTASSSGPTITAPVVTWGAATDATSGVAYYRVLRGPLATGPWTQANVDGATTGTSFTDTGASFGTVYYLVRAVDNAGNVATGGTASAGVVYHRAPNLPVHATPANGATNQSLTPSLTASYADADAHAGTLTYEVCSDSSCASLVTSGTTASSASGTSPSWTITPSLVKGTTYWWRVRATDSLGATSVWTSTWSFTTSPGPTITDNQAGDATWRNANTGSYDVDLSDPVGLTGFETTVWTGAGQTGTQLQGWTQVAALATTSYTTNWALLASTWTVLPQGTSYVSVRATNAFGITNTLTDAFFVQKDVTAAAPASVADGPGADIAFWGSASTMQANWPASTGEAGLSGVLRYEYCIATGADCTGTVARSWTSNGATTTLSATGLTLTNGATYRIAVRMVDNAGNTSSVVSSNGQLVDATAPSAPTLVSPAASASLSSLPSFTATYLDPAPATNGQLSFEVCADASCASVVTSGTSATGLASGSNGSWTPASLVAGSYWWRARGTDSAGTAGAWSATSAFVLSYPPLAPTLVSPSDGVWVNTATPTLTATFRDTDAGATGQLTFEACATNPADPWSSNCASGLQSGSSAAGIAANANGSWVVATSVPNGETRYWRVRGTDNVSSGPWSVVRSFRVDTQPPTAVTGLGGTTPTTAPPALTWTAASDGESGVAYYRVYRSTAAGTLGTQVNVDGATTSTSFTDSTPPAAGPWYYTVRAVDAVGNERTTVAPQVAIEYVESLYLRSTAATNLTGAWRLQVVPGSSADTSTAPKIGTGSGFVQLEPGLAPNSPTFVGSLPASPNGRGWIFEQAPGRSHAAGTWRFHVTTTASNTHVGYVNVRPWKVTLSGSSIGTATPLAGWTQGTTNAGAVTSAQNHFVDVALPLVTFAAGEYLYVEYWENITTPASGGGSTNTRMTFTVETAQQRIVPTVLAPTDTTPPLTPTIVGPPAGSGHPSWPALTATYLDPAPATNGQLTYELCSDAACTSVVQGGTSAAGLTPGSDGTWTPTAPNGSYWWRVRATDGASNVGPWSTPIAVQVGSYTLGLSVSGPVSLGVLSPGSAARGSTTATVSSNGIGGYQLLASDASDTVGLAGAANVPDWTGTVATPSAWPTATTGYVGVGVRDATGGRLAKWGTAGGPWAETDDVNNRYAGLTSTPQLLHSRSTFDLASESVLLTWRFTPSTSTTAGAYSSTVTLTLVGSP